MRFAPAISASASGDGLVAEATVIIASERQP